MCYAFVDLHKKSIIYNRYCARVKFIVLTIIKIFIPSKSFVNSDLKAILCTKLESVSISYLLTKFHFP